MELIWKTDINPELKIKPSVSVIDDREDFVITDKGITLLKMKPGETRYIKINYAVDGGKEGLIFPL